MKPQLRRAFLIGCVIPLFWIWSAGQANAQPAFQTMTYTLDISPADPSTSTDVELNATLNNSSCIGVGKNGIIVDLVNQTIDLSLNVAYVDFLGPCPLSGGPYKIPIGKLVRQGVYQVSVYEDNQSGRPGVTFDPDNKVGTFELTVNTSSPTAFAETPTEGSIQSGIGVVRGWACDASKVEIQFNEEPRRPVAYGTSRTDTNAICGDDNNGYGMVLAWGLLGHGTHRMQTFIDNIQVADVEFSVDGLSDPFVKGLAAEYRLDDFPSAGNSAIVRWSEADQNFIIIDVIE